MLQYVSLLKLNFKNIRDLSQSMTPALSTMDKCLGFLLLIKWLQLPSSKNTEILLFTQDFSSASSTHWDTKNNRPNAKFFHETYLDFFESQKYELKKKKINFLSSDWKYKAVCISTLQLKTKQSNIRVKSKTNKQQNKKTVGTNQYFWRTNKRS